MCVCACVSVRACACVYVSMRALVCLLLGYLTPIVASFRHPPGASDTCLARNFSNLGTGNIMSRIAPWVHPVGRFEMWRESDSIVDSSRRVRLDAHACTIMCVNLFPNIEMIARSYARVVWMFEIEAGHVLAAMTQRMHPMIFLYFPLHRHMCVSRAAPPVSARR